MDVGRARRGVSGALYSQTALARLTSYHRSVRNDLLQFVLVLIVGSYAARVCELRQVRKKAAVSVLFGCCRLTWIELC